MSDPLDKAHEAAADEAAADEPATHVAATDEAAAHDAAAYRAAVRPYMPILAMADLMAALGRREEATKLVQMVQTELDQELEPKPNPEKARQRVTSLG